MQTSHVQIFCTLYSNDSYQTQAYTTPIPCSIFWQYGTLSSQSLGFLDMTKILPIDGTTRPHYNRSMPPTCLCGGAAFVPDGGAGCTRSFSARFNSGARGHAESRAACLSILFVVEDWCDNINRIDKLSLSRWMPRKNLILIHPAFIWTACQFL